MKTASVNVDLSKTVGRIKPMHSIGQPPITGLSNSLFYYLKRAGIPYSRLHDVGGWLGGGLYVDVPNLFRDFDADENDPASYDFAFTDKIILGLCENGCEPYFRLGVTIENQHMLKSYRIYPPKDYAKWARICEHIVRHYNEGWANGYKLGITYWEIWNEPDDCYENETAAMWKGTPEQYFELYSVAARHLKSCFGNSIKVGGYGHCGVYEYAKDETLTGIENEEYIYDFTINFLHGFLRYQRDTGAPIDFFSWHVYDNCHESTRQDFSVIAKHAEYVRRVLDRYGFTGAEHHLNEWNLFTDRRHRDSEIASAKMLSFMLMMQGTSTEVMCFYDGGLGYSDYRGLINPDSGYPYRSYYALTSFNSLYKLGSCVKTEADGVFACAARSGREACVLLANPTGEEVTAVLTLEGLNVSSSQVCRIDAENRYTVTGEAIEDRAITLPPYGCAEIKLYDLE